MLNNVIATVDGARLATSFARLLTCLASSYLFVRIGMGLLPT